MMVFLIIVCIFSYLAIGGIVAGAANEDDFEALMITIAWPIFCIMVLCCALWKFPYKFGDWLRCNYLIRKLRRKR